ncbi:MAG: hypothetical protein ABSE28_24370 [Candidatus Sulfotelmatobacter sp.]|jgi:hypothetical protein
MNRGYSTVQVARMLGVDEQTLLLLLEVSRRPGSKVAATSEIAVERTVQRKYHFPCPCGATMISNEKTVICTDCGRVFGIRRVGKRTHWHVNTAQPIGVQDAMELLERPVMFITLLLLLLYWLYV